MIQILRSSLVMYTIIKKIREEEDLNKRINIFLEAISKSSGLPHSMVHRNFVKALEEYNKK